MLHLIAIAEPADPTAQVVKMAFVVIGLVLLAFVAVGFVKRRLKRADEEASMSAGTGFTLSDLRQLHKSGQMSTEEFERAKEKIIAAAKRAEARTRGPEKPREIVPKVEPKPPQADGEQTGS